MSALKTKKAEVAETGAGVRGLGKPRKLQFVVWGQI